MFLGFGAAEGLACPFFILSVCSPLRPLNMETINTEKMKWIKESHTFPFEGIRLEDFIGSLPKNQETEERIISSISIEKGMMTVEFKKRPEEEQARLKRLEKERQELLDAAAKAEKERREQQRRDTLEKQVILQIKKEERIAEKKAEEEKAKEEEKLSEIKKAETEESRKKQEELIKDPKTPVNTIDFEILGFDVGHFIAPVFDRPLFTIPEVRKHLLEKLDGIIPPRIYDSLMTRSELVGTATLDENNLKDLSQYDQGYIKKLIEKMYNLAQEVHPYSNYQTVRYYGDGEKMTGFSLLLRDKEEPGKIITVGDVIKAYNERVEARKAETKIAGYHNAIYQMTDEEIFLSMYVSRKESRNLIAFMRKYGLIPENKYIFLQ